MTGDLHIPSLRYTLRTDLQPDGCWGLCPQTPEVYPLWEYPVKMKKSSNISVAALHRFIPQPASGRSSALPCLAAILVLSEIWRLLRLHGLFFGTENPAAFIAEAFSGTGSNVLVNEAKRLYIPEQPLERQTCAVPRAVCYPLKTAFAGILKGSG